MFRNLLLPIVFILLPIAMMNVVPRIATQEVKNLNITVIDCDHSTLSSRLIQKLQASEFFNLYAICPNYEKAYALLEEGKVDFIVTIENEFEHNLYRTGGADVMVTVNAVNGMKGGLGNAYLTQIMMQYARQLTADNGTMAKPPVNVEPRYLFNASLDYKPYMIPVLMAMTLILLVSFLPALNVVGEKERGTIEQINVTPVSRIEFILSKMIPYWTIGIFIVGFSMILAWKIHDVVPAGSVWLVFLFNIVYIFTISSLGLTISNYSDNMRQAAICHVLLHCNFYPHQRTDFTYCFDASLGSGGHAPESAALHHNGHARDLSERKLFPSAPASVHTSLHLWYPGKYMGCGEFPQKQLATSLLRVNCCRLRRMFLTVHSPQLSSVA